MTSELPEDKWYIYDWIDIAQNQLDPDYATLSQVLQMADDIIHAHPELPEAHHLRAWVLYKLWDHGFGGSRIALDGFNTVLRLDPGHQWSLWSAIVLSSVLGEDEATIDYFSRLDRAYFADEGKDWRYLKAWEYALCSHLRLGRFETFKTGLKRLMQEFLNVADDVDEILERPNQLIATYNWMRLDSRKFAVEIDSDELIILIKEQLYLLVPGGWVDPGELD